jgi:putative ABC transport system permease protein
MLKNYFKIAWRNLLRYKGFSLINIFGLAIGLTCCILVSLFIIDELSYDKYHKDSARIYRVVKDFVNDDGSKLPDATTPPAIGAAIQKDIPEIEHMARLMPGWGGKFYVRNGEKKFIEENVYRADSSIFDVFTFQFIQGTPATALKDQHALVLTESAAKKYFGKEDPMGKTLEIDDLEPQMVTAVIKDVPDNSHFKFDILLPLRFRNNGQLIDINSIWGWYNYYTYMKLKPGTTIAAVDKKIRDVFKKNQPENKNYFYSQAVTDIHLTSNLKWELRSNSDKIYIRVFGTIALFILLIACINYVNLTTARSSLRAREIGIRKVSGALRSALIRQFLTESILISLLAAIVALAMAQLLLPAINTITGKDLSLTPGGNYMALLIVLVFAIVLGLIAGIYPALFLSSFEPIKVLKGEKLSGFRRFSLRKVLVVTQFTISIALIIGTIIVIQQINFIQNAKLGLNKDHVIVMNDVGYLNRSDKQKLKNDLLQLPGVKKVAGSDGIVGGQNWTNVLRVRGSKNGQLVNFLSVDNNFIDVLGIEIKEGRKFLPEFTADTMNTTVSNGQLDQVIGSVIVNEKAVKDLGIPSPAVGKQIVWGNDGDTTYYLNIVGVAKDFHFASLKNEIKPFVFVSNPRRWGNFTIKLSGTDISQSIASVKKIWDANVKTRPFQYSFLDETYAGLYKSEMNFKTIFFYITFIAIFIACLGLFGLSSFITEQRTKEIGIRKVLGASVSGIVGMLSKDFVKLILIAALIAFPVSWWAMHKWLQDFVYRIDIGWWVFAAAAVVALLIALITISSQAIKAAIANPVKSLRTE